MAKQEIRWTSSQRGKVQHAYIGQRLVGFMKKEIGPLGPRFYITHCTDKGHDDVGLVGAPTHAEAQTQARAFLEAIINA